MTEEVERKDGKFVKGQSGNPAGRPVGSRNQITVLRENTELALRRYMDSPARAALAQKALDRLFKMSVEGNDKEALQAMKILFDKILPNAKSGIEDKSGSKRPIAIQIINQTDKSAGSPVVLIDGEAEEV